ncbi:precorrin-8X methylmutase [Fusibacter paucivorans]|nr:precorrin-8X methylmutase [Fusibacter paucivorans]
MNKEMSKTMHKEPLTYIKDPMGIETKSFEIIDEIIHESGRTYPAEDALTKAIYRRVIHTSADFDYLDNLKIDQAFLDAFEKTVEMPLTLYTDTNMALSGINKTAIGKLPWTLKCFVSDENAKVMAKAQGITRSMAAIQLALEEPGLKLFVLGNAPTAIFQLLDFHAETNPDVIGVIGVPVGFVGAAESKDALFASSIPCITALGRKGGSNVAASIVNALVYHFKGR